MNPVTASSSQTVDVSDIYTGSGRLTATSSAQASNAALNENNQLARIANRSSSLMRLPQAQYYTQQGVGTALVDGNQNQPLVSGSSLGIGVGVGPGVGIGGDMYGDLAPLIRKAKGKKANIPPFVQKLSQ